MRCRDEAIERYAAWLLDQPDLVAKVKRELRGKVLGCWCAPLACHGHTLAFVANDETDYSAWSAEVRAKVEATRLATHPGTQLELTDLAKR